MKRPSAWKSVAAASAIVLLATACADGNDSSDSDDNDSDVEGLPAAEMRDWDVDCDWYLLDDFQDFLGFDEWWTGPMEADHGGGSNPAALTCEASFFWPEFETPHGRVIAADATFGYDVYPRDSPEEAEELYEHRVDHMQGNHPDSETISSGSVEGDWLASHYFLTETNVTDLYFIVLQGEDFVMDFRIDIPSDPTDGYEESDLVPGEWAGFEFDRDSASEFFFEEQMPNIYDQFMTLLEREG